MSDTATAPAKVTGSCACGKIRFSTVGEIRSTVYCYCTTCRKCSGAEYLPFVHFFKGQIKWEGTPDEWSKTSLAVRTFCAACSSTIAMMYHTASFELGINLGMIDEGIERIKPVSMCIFVDEAPPWAVLPSGVPHYGQFPPKEQN